MLSPKLDQTPPVPPAPAPDVAGRRGRRYERIRLSRPIVARLGSLSVVLSDISVIGARVEHNVQLATGNMARLSFRWNDENIEIQSKVVRSKLERFSSGSDGLTIYHSGLEFIGSSPEGARALHQMISSHIIRALEEQKANARGVVPEDLDEMPIFRGGVLSQGRRDGGGGALPVNRIARQAAFISFRLDKMRWRRTWTTSREQPEDGFTVSSDEEQEQLHLLCRTYENADSEGRRLIRIFAQLSVTEGEGVPPGRYEP